MRMGGGGGGVTAGGIAHLMIHGEVQYLITLLGCQLIGKGSSKFHTNHTSLRPRGLVSTRPWPR
jgi:hypothetical protein